MRVRSLLSGDNRALSPRLETGQQIKGFILMTRQGFMKPNPGSAASPGRPAARPDTRSWGGASRAGRGACQLAFDRFKFIRSQWCSAEGLFICNHFPSVYRVMFYRFRLSRETRDCDPRPDVLPDMALCSAKHLSSISHCRSPSGVPVCQSREAGGSHHQPCPVPARPSRRYAERVVC